MVFSAEWISATRKRGASQRSIRPERNNRKTAAMATAAAIPAHNIRLLTEVRPGSGPCFTPAPPMKNAAGEILSELPSQVHEPVWLSPAANGDVHVPFKPDRTHQLGTLG